MKIQAGYISGFIWLKIVLITAVSVLSACDQAVMENNPDESSKVFSSAVKLYPDDFFQPGYTESYAITGYDNKGKSYRGSFEILTEDQDMFNGRNAVPVKTTLSYSTVINGVQMPPLTNVLTLYFSAEPPLQYLGSVNSRSSVITESQGQLYDIPAQLLSEQSGTLGDTVGSDASLESITWTLVEVGADIYELSFHTVSSDSSGAVLIDESQIFELSPDGSRLSWKLIASVPGLDTSFNFTSVP